MKKTVARLGKLYHWVVQPLLVLIILLIGYFSAKGLTLFKQEPPKNKPAIYAPLVNTISSHIENRTLFIRGTGTLQARTRINIVPQVGGRIMSIHPQLRAGGYFKANATLLEIEQIDYQLAVTSAASEVASAKRSQQLEIAEAKAAIEEWHALHNNEPVPILVSRQPQIAEAKANFQAAQARLQQAKINLKRTRISMPFAGRVVQASIDVGEVINANQSVGMVYSSELLEIPVPLEINQLAWLNLAPIDAPKQNTSPTDSTNSSAQILISLAGQEHRLPGQLIRVESELDSVSRLARVVIALNASEIPELLREEVIPGLFVNVEIKARELQDITVLPRSVLREHGVLWVVKDQKLIFVTPQIIYQSDSEIWLRALPANTIIINNTLEVVTQGMQVRIQEPQ